jgi:hypothetical protein
MEGQRALGGRQKVERCFAVMEKYNWLTLILGTFSTNTYQGQIIFNRMLSYRLHLKRQAQLAFYILLGHEKLSFKWAHLGFLYKI